MVNATFSMKDTIQDMNERNKKLPISEEQANSFQFKTKKQMRDFKRFTMNSVYNFYQEGVLQRYVLKIGELNQ